MSYSEEAIFCVKYLKDCGFLSEDNLTEIEELAKDFDVSLYTRTLFKLKEVREI